MPKLSKFAPTRPGTKVVNFKLPGQILGVESDGTVSVEVSVKPLNGKPFSEELEDRVCSQLGKEQGYDLLEKHAEQIYDELILRQIEISR